MTLEQMTMIIDSYGLEFILEDFDIEPSYVIKLLIDEEMIDEQEFYDKYYSD